MLHIDNLTISIGKSITIFEGLTLSVERGEILGIFGPSGSGKSTLVNAVAGFLKVGKRSGFKNQTPTPFSPKWFRGKADGPQGLGDISVNGHSIVGLQPGERPLGLVLQKFGTYPHMTGRQNIAFPLICLGRSMDEVEPRVLEVAKLCGLSVEKLNQKVQTLSGGEAQRVAIAKMIIKQAQIGLLDEPFSHLDQILRIELIELLRGIVDDVSGDFLSAAVLVSHDWREIKYTDKALLMNAREDDVSIVRVLKIDRAHSTLSVLRTVDQLELDRAEIKWISGLQRALQSS